MPANDPVEPVIHVKGAREHNLKNLDVAIPRGKFVVITGVSGSGKSSLALDTIYAEGYRKYIDSLSTKAKMVLDQMKRPDVDFITGLPPVIAIEQRKGTGGNPRSTVATVTEIADYARLLWSVCGVAHCPKDGGLIERRTIDDCVERLFAEPEGSRVILLARGPSGKPSFLREEFQRIRHKGYQRVRIGGEIKHLDDVDVVPKGRAEHQVDIVIDRLVLREDQRSRLADSLELAFREGEDRAVALVQADRAGPFTEVVVSQHLACVVCGTVYEPITPKSFSYSHPSGACPTCGGVGRTRQFQADLLVPDPGKSVKNGAIKPWRIGSKRMIIQRNAILKQLAEQLPFDPTLPWQDLDAEVRNQIVHGTGDRLFSFKLKAGKAKPEPQTFAGVIADLEDSFQNTSSDGLRARLMTYQTSQTCPDCKGQRLRDTSLHVLLADTNFAEFVAMDVTAALAFMDRLPDTGESVGRVGEATNGLRERLRFLDEVGLGYLTLSRSYDTLSGGESQRVRLATQLGMGLVGVAYVLDEPSIGLHPVDNDRLIQTLTDLRDRGNALIVVEHDEDTMRAADHLLELGPGAGAAGGTIIYEGAPADAAHSKTSLSGQYLGRQLEVEKNAKTKVAKRTFIEIEGASENNLRDVDVRFPEGLLTVVTGVSGSGKSTLVTDILGAAAAFRLNGAKAIPGRHRALRGLEYFSTTVRVDQEPIGRSPRSNPATFIKLFDLLRTLYAQAPLAKVRGYTPSRFSFNVRGGRCERCKGDGVIELDMQFLSNVYIECPSCGGKRYNRETLEVRFKGHNIAEVLDMSVDEGATFFARQPKIAPKLATLVDVGLGYLKLGQPAPTLSGGEAQRIKLALELSKRNQGDTLYILDEPTTGLHWADIQKLMDLLFKLRDQGNTVVIIEHSLEVINLADWIIDLGPGGGTDGGELIFQGPLEGIYDAKTSRTGDCLARWRKR